jgi:hypothetical protein
VIKYQDTTVEVEQTLGELAALIRRYGDARFEQSWDEDGRMGSVRFAVRHDTLGELPVLLTARTARIEAIMREAGLWKSYEEEAREERLSTQTHRIAWRHLKDLTEQLLLAVSLGLKTLPEAFLADVEVLDPAAGETLTMARFLDRHASAGSRGLELESGPPRRGPIALPGAHDPRPSS